MKGLSELLIIVVTVIVILIAAFVVVSIFGKGTGGVVETGFRVRATAHCTFVCSSGCTLNQDGNTPKGWSAEVVREGDLSIACSTLITCDCAKEKSTNSLPQPAWSPGKSF